MAARFHRKESAASGFRRLVGEQTGMLVSLLADQGGKSAERIHEARVELKRMRALLHLAKSGLDGDVFVGENQTFRDTGRKLAQAREAEVNLAVFDALAGSRLDDAAANVRALLEDQVTRMHRKSVRAARLAGIAGTLRASGHVLCATRLEVDEWPLLAPALHASYRRARKVRSISRDRSRETELHESRKCVKQLFYQLEFLRRALGKPARKAMARMRKLAEMLGEHHDVCILRQTLKELSAHGIAAADSAALAEKIEGKLARLLKKIRKQSAAAFDQRTRSFLKSVHANWKQWRAGAGET